MVWPFPVGSDPQFSTTSICLSSYVPSVTCALCHHVWSWTFKLFKLSLGPEPACPHAVRPQLGPRLLQRATWGIAELLAIEAN